MLADAVVEGEEEGYLGEDGDHRGGLITVGGDEDEVGYYVEN
jgi:hypothetical protein